MSSSRPTDETRHPNHFCRCFFFKNINYRIMFFQAWKWHFLTSIVLFAQNKSIAHISSSITKRCKISKKLQFLEVATDRHFMLIIVWHQRPPNRVDLFCNVALKIQFSAHLHFLKPTVSSPLCTKWAHRARSKTLEIPIPSRIQSISSNSHAIWSPRHSNRIYLRFANCIRHTKVVVPNCENLMHDCWGWGVLNGVLHRHQ